ncbi:MAG: hypothetical protein ACREE9_06270 [Stellaceae bacterium]
MFYWIIGRAYFVMKNYDDALVRLRKSVELRGNAWYTRAYLLSTYALTGRDTEPEAIAALTEFKTRFGEYTVQRIRDVYEKENPQRDRGMKESIEQLSNGLLSVGVPELIASQKKAEPGQRRAATRRSIPRGHLHRIGRRAEHKAGAITTPARPLVPLPANPTLTGGAAQPDPPVRRMRRAIDQRCTSEGPS